MGSFSLPDWSAAIGSQMTAMFGWSPLNNGVNIIIGSAIAVIVISLFIGIFVKR